MPKFVEGFAAKLVVPPGERDVQVFDDALPGFGLRKFASGKASYFVKFVVNGQQRRLTLGAVVHGNLSEMRKQASAILAKARLGEDVVAEKRAAASKRTLTLGELAEKYLAEREAEMRPRSFAEIKRHIEQHWRPLHDMPIETISRREVVGVIESLATDHGKVAADRARTALSTLFAWAIDRNYVETNPTLSIKSRGANGGRSRVLTESELAEVWRACLDNDHGRIVRLLILTGQRRTEIGDLAWSEIDAEKRQFELPEHRTKNGRAHIVPLSNEAWAILTDIERREDRDLVFGRGAGGFTGWSKAKAELDERIARNRKEAGIEKPMPEWTLHDLRRSFVTHMSECGFAPPHIIEAICNHVSGHKGGVAGVYNRATYLAEKRQALETWGAHIAALTK